MTRTEIERAIESIWTLFQETDRRFRETDQRLDQRFKETEQRIAEANRRFEATERGD